MITLENEVRVVEGYVVYGFANSWTPTRYNLPVDNEPFDGIPTIFNSLTTDDHLLNYWNEDTGEAWEVIYGLDELTDRLLIGAEEFHPMNFHTVSYSRNIGVIDCPLRADVQWFDSVMDAIASIPTLLLKREVA